MATKKKIINYNIDEMIKFLTSAAPEIEKEVRAEEVTESQILEEREWKQAEREQALLRSKLSNQEYKDEIEFRNYLTRILLGLTTTWLIFIAVIIILQGLHNTIFFMPNSRYVFGFYLEPNVMIAILSTTTLTVLGLFLVVTKHIFYRGGSDSKKETSSNQSKS
ncbi:MAG: hypothetical protein ACYCQI_13635 [Gammaproteobacteria bacterium]